MNALAFVTDAFGGVGGIAKYNRDLLTALAASPRLNRIVVLPRVAARPLEPIPDGIDFRRDALGGNRSYLRAFARTLVSLDRVDFVLCCHTNLLLPSYAAALRYRCPIYFMTYGIEVWKPTSNRLARAVIARLDAVMSISQTTLERFLTWAPLASGRTCILPNAFDPGSFAPGPKDPELEQRYGLAGKTVLMTLGRLSTLERMKGFDEMIALLPQLLARDPNLVYAIMGEGDDRARLQAKAEALGVNRSVVFTGPISEAEKAAHYRLPDLYVMPSVGEGFGFVFLEALACGIPVVASKLDGGREAVRDGMLGILVDPKDPRDLERGIWAGLRQPRGQVPIGLDYFSFDAFTQRVHDWLRDVQGDSRGS